MTSGKVKMAVVGLGMLVGSNRFVAGAGSEAELPKALSSSRQTLASGIEQAQSKAPETAISAKFEMDGKWIGSPADTWTPRWRCSMTSPTSPARRSSSR